MDGPNDENLKQALPSLNRPIVEVHYSTSRLEEHIRSPIQVATHRIMIRIMSRMAALKATLAVAPVPKVMLNK